MDPSQVGRFLLWAAVVAAIAGGVFLLLGKMGIGSLPGDMRFGKGNVKVYFPLGTSILISIILTILLNLFLRRR